MVRIWDVETGKEERTFSILPDALKKQSYFVRGSYLSPGGKTVAAANTILVIDLPKRHPLGLRQLLKTLNCLSCNLVTNGGNAFLGVRDDKKLRQLIDNIQTELSREKRVEAFPVPHNRPLCHLSEWV